MANLTVVIPDDVLRRARVRAIQQNTSVNAVVREYLGSYVDGDGPSRAAHDFLAIARASQAGSGPSGRTWIREDAYDRNEPSTQHD